MSKSSSQKKTKSAKALKSSSKLQPIIEIQCKFRGKYDLNKKKINKEINLENAINLFEVIYKKNEKLYKDTSIKMYRDKKTFTFGDKKGFSKVHHRVPYTQVNKFFVLHRDPTMIIMGVNHKTHKWFLVFQFNNVEDLTRFCDEIEGEKRAKTDVTEVVLPTSESHTMAINVPQIQLESEDMNDYAYENSNELERYSIHSEMINTKEMASDNFDDSFYEPDLNTRLNEAISVGSRPSSRSSDDSQDSRIHCDDLSRSRLKDLYLKPGSTMYLDTSDWEEDLTCLNYSTCNDLQQNEKLGSIYMYCAQFKSKSISDLFSDDSFSLSSGDGHKYHDYQPKFITNADGESHHFNHFEPKLITDDSVSFNHYDPKIVVNEHGRRSKGEINDEMDSFEHYNPKLIDVGK